MKKLTTVLLLLIYNIAISQTCQWASGFGSSTNFEGSNAVVVDAAGNVYATGHFSGTVDFDPGAGVTNLTSAGPADIFIIKMTASGNLVWAKNVGGPNTCSDQSIGVDGSGNVYICVNYDGTVDVDPGVGVYSLASSGLTDFFVLKLDSSGNFVWGQSFGSSAGNDYSAAILVDTTAIYVCGGFTGAVDFDASAGSSILFSAGGLDGFVYKADLAGNLIWVKQYNGSGEQLVTSVGIDAAKNVYTAGYFGGSGDFDPGAGTSTLTSSGFNDVFYTKLNASGNYVFAKSFGGSGFEYPSGLVMDKYANIYIAGAFANTVDFDPGAGTASFTSPGGLSDVFVAKYDTNGNYSWAESFGGPNDEGTGLIATDTVGNIYLTGNYIGTVDFDPSAATFNLSTIGATQNAFLLKLNWAGNFVWAGSISGSGEYGLGVAADNNNGYASGGFNGSCDFGSGIMVSSTGGSQDAYIAKYNFVSTGIAVEEKGNSLSVYPNPAMEQLTIDLNEAEKTTVEIYTVDGRRLKDMKTESARTNIDITDLSNGVYIVKTTGPKGISVKRFVKYQN